MTTKLKKIEELSSDLGVNQSWLRYKIFRKEIPHLKIGKHVRFDPEVVKSWVENQSVKIRGGK